MTSKYTKEFVEQVFSEKQEKHLTYKQLKDLYGVDFQYYFKKYNLTKSTFSRSESRKTLLYTFDSITTEIEAYTLGLLLSDGDVSYNNQVKIKLKNTDSEIKVLTTIRDYICPEQPLKTEKNAVILRISSKEICENLQKYGVIPNKTENFFDVPNIPHELMPHFIRGYFDGDGTVFKDRKYLKCNICSINEEFLKQLQDVLSDFKIESRINVEIREGKTYMVVGREVSTCKNMYRLFVSKQEEIKKFKHLMYDSATIYLQRKFDKFIENDELT